MKERPILFNSKMVRAILDGSKTQTRRIMKNQPTQKPKHIFPEGGFWFVVNERSENGRWGYMADLDKPQEWNFDCPFGKVGDRLWVRETWADVRGMGFDHPSGISSLKMQVAYKADCSEAGLVAAADYGVKWKPSIHMPRWASRITLEITGIRIERMQDGGDRDFWGEEKWAENPWVWVIEFKKVDKNEA